MVVVSFAARVSTRGEVCPFGVYVVLGIAWARVERAARTVRGR